MTTPTFNDRFIACRKAPGVYHDPKVPGLEFRVRASGAASWSLRYRHRGAQKRYTLGGYPAIGLAEARDRAKTALRNVDDGIDPQAAKVERRAADTVAELAQTYIEVHAKKKKRSWKVDQWMLDRHVLPIWKDRLARDITRRDVRELVEAIDQRGTPILANRIRALLSKLFVFACSRDLIDASPVVGVERPGVEHSRDRVLGDDEIRQFWTATEPLDPTMRAWWRVRLLTAQRGIEINTMRWTDIDLAGGWWTIPAEVAKNKMAHRVPLSPPVIALLAELPREGSYVFEGARGKRQQGVAAASFALIDFRGHDLRRTAASRMTGAGIPRLHVGRVLNHAETGVTAVYDRHGYDAEKRIALDTWARTLDGILTATASAVVPFVKPKPIRIDADIRNADWPKKRTRDIDADGQAAVRR